MELDLAKQQVLVQIIRKASTKLDTDENILNQKDPNGQKMI